MYGAYSECYTRYLAVVSEGGVHDHDRDSSDLDEPISWLSPRNYPSRPSETLNLVIAENVLHGATPYAAGMAVGVAPSRLRQWMKWGSEAYDSDEGPADYHSIYLDLFLKVMQAAGLAAIPAMVRVYQMNPTWWLSHAPDTRGELGGDDLQAVIPLPDPTVVESAVPNQLSVIDTAEARGILREMVQMGMATPAGAVAPDIPDAPDSTGQEPPAEEGTGTV